MGKVCIWNTALEWKSVLIAMQILKLSGQCVSSLTNGNAKNGCDIFCYGHQIEEYRVWHWQGQLSNTYSMFYWTTFVKHQSLLIGEILKFTKIDNTMKDFKHIKFLTLPNGNIIKMYFEINVLPPSARRILRLCISHIRKWLLV